jgi:Beta-propeller repeat
MRCGYLLALLVACGDDGGNARMDGGGSDSDSDSGSDDAAPAVAISTFVTYLGGNNFEQARDVVVDREGNVIVVGGTQSPNFVTTAGAYDTTFDNSGTGMLGSGGPMDVFVTKFSPTGAIVWSTFVGGPSYDRAYGVEVDAAGDIYIAGRAGAGFPTTNGVLQPTFAGDMNTNGLYGPQDGFIAKLSKDGSTLLWSTYFGGDDRDFIRDLDIDGSAIYVGVGELTRPHPHVTSGAFDTTLGAQYEQLVAKVALDGTSVLWGSYFGGSGQDGVPTVRAGSDGSLFLISSTTSTNLPTTAGAMQMNNAGGEDFFVAKFAANGASLVYCTYLGGNGNDSHETHHGVVNAQGEVIVGFYSTSTNFATTANAIKGTSTGGADAIVARISANGSTLLAGTYIGGNGGEDVQGLAVDASGRIYVGGSTDSTDLPVTAGAHQMSPSPNGNMFVAELSADLTAISYMTYLGGGADDQQRSLAIDGNGNIVTVGQTSSTQLTTTAGAAQATYGTGPYDAIVGAFRIH